MLRNIVLIFALAASHAAQLPALKPVARKKSDLLAAAGNSQSELFFSQQNVGGDRAGIYSILEGAGTGLCDDATAKPLKLFMRSLIAGMCVGIGGLLCASVGGDMGVPFWEAGNGMARFMFGAIGYPLSIFMVVLTGASAFTGNLALVANAVRAGTATLADAIKVLVITYFGCWAGGTAVGALAAGGNMPGLAACRAITQHKLELTAMETLVRGIGGGSLIGCAVSFATAAMRAGARLIDVIAVIWFPISTYVIVDFEHCLANHFFFAAAVFSGGAFEMDDLKQNLIFSTLGNAIGAALVAGLLLPISCNPKKIDEQISA